MSSCNIAALRDAGARISNLSLGPLNIVASFLKPGLSIIAFYLAFDGEMRSCAVAMRIKLNSNSHA